MGYNLIETLDVRRNGMAVDMFLKLDGVEGESVDKNHAQEIDVLAWNWGASHADSNHMGAGRNISRKTNVQNLSFTHYYDCASTTLLQRLFEGKVIKEGELVVRKAGERSHENIRIKIKNILISSLSTGGSTGEDRLTENVELNFSQVEITYIPQNADGSAGDEKIMGWDISTNMSTI